MTDRHFFHPSGKFTKSTYTTIRNLKIKLQRIQTKRSQLHNGIMFSTNFRYIQISMKCSWLNAQNTSFRPVRFRLSLSPLSLFYSALILRDFYRCRKTCPLIGASFISRCQFLYTFCLCPMVLRWDVTVRKMCTHRIQAKSDSEAVIHRNGTIKYSHDWSHSTEGFNRRLDLCCERSPKLGVWIHTEFEWGWYCCLVI